MCGGQLCMFIPTCHLIAYLLFQFLSKSKRSKVDSVNQADITVMENQPLSNLYEEDLSKPPPYEPEDCSYVNESAPELLEEKVLSI